jgi:hypothetical protein
MSINMFEVLQQRQEWRKRETPHGDAIHLESRFEKERRFDYEMAREDEVLRADARMFEVTPPSGQVPQ